MDIFVYVSSSRPPQGSGVACKYLTGKGWTILDRNWATRFGELDLIARDGEQLVIVEVRSTSGERFG